MIKKYYKYGLRPIIEEVEKEYSTFYAFQWENGEFIEDMTYASKIWFDYDADREDLSEQEFDAYVERLKKERGLV